MNMMLDQVAFADPTFSLPRLAVALFPDLQHVGLQRLVQTQTKLTLKVSTSLAKCEYGRVCYHPSIQ
jgi:hypothetical protein